MSKRRTCVLLLAAAASMLGTTGCLRNKMATPESIKTQGLNARQLDVVPVQSDTGSAALCLYSVQADSSRQLVTQQALLQGELLTGLETIPGIDGVRSSVIADMVGPAAVVLAGVTSAAAGRYIPVAALPERVAEAPAAAVQTVLPLENPEAMQALANFRMKQDARVKKLIDRTVSNLEKSGFSFADTDASRGAFQALDNYKNGRLSAADFMKVLDGFTQNASTDVKEQFRASRVIFDGFASHEQKITKEIFDGKIRPSLLNMTTDLPQAVPAGRFAGVKQAARNTAKSFSGNFNKLCGGGATGKQLYLKTGLCAAGTLIAGGGVLWGAGNLAFGNAMTINTDSLRSALVADAASRPDVVIDDKTYDALISGLSTFSNQLMASNPDLASRPSCPQ